MIGENRFHLSRLVAIGPLKKSEITFTTGLNVVEGPTDSGKSFILESIDFMLGSESELRGIPELYGYSSFYLEINMSRNAKYTFKRNVGAKDVKVYSTGFDSITDSILFEEMGLTKFKKFLNALMGADGIKLKKNVDNEVVSLTLRNFRDYFILEEGTIFGKNLGLISSQYTERTIYKSLFSYVLSGKEFSHLSRTPEQKTKDVEEGAKRETLIKLASRLQRSLEKEKRSANDLRPLATVEAELKILKKEKQTADKTFSSKFEKLVGLENKYNDLLKEEAVQVEKINRFNILDSHYTSDVRRLEFVFESMHLTDQLPPSSCPYCGSVVALSATNSHACIANEKNFEIGIVKEISKISKNQLELRKTLAFVAKENQALSLLKVKTSEDLSIAREDFNINVKPILAGIESKVIVLQAERDKAWKIEMWQNELNHLLSLYDFFELSPEKEKIKDDIVFNEDGINELSSIVSETLGSWKFKGGSSSVGFDLGAFDFNVGGKKRSDYGKGSRAIFTFAFYFSLLKFCLAKGRVHPGILIVDSPFNPFKGKEVVDSEGKVSSVEVDNIYRALSTIDKGMQIIILENDGPPKDVIQNCNHELFVEENAMGRKGFL